jgi:hypothetical protein
VAIAYWYTINNGGDALKYWFSNTNLNNIAWSDYFNFGSDIIFSLNYPLVKYLHLPLYVGFLIYAIIGYFGILEFYNLAKKLIGSQLIFFKVNWLPIFMFLPSLHFWTSILGKDPIVFFAIASFINGFYVRENKLKIFLSLFVIAFIRPHMALFLIGCFLMPYIVFKYKEIKNIFQFSLITITSIVFSTVIFLNVSKIKTIDYEKAIRHNEYVINELKNAPSFIPMESYNFPEKIFTINFRPLFFDTHNYLGVLVSLENTFIILLHLSFLWLLLFYFKKIKWNFLLLSIIVYNVVCSSIFVQRYSDLGLLIRTKNMFQPFMLLVILAIFSQVFIIKKTINER